MMDEFDGLILDNIYFIRILNDPILDRQNHCKKFSVICTLLSPNFEIDSALNRKSLFDPSFPIFILSLYLLRVT